LFACAFINSVVRSKLQVLFFYKKATLIIAVLVLEKNLREKQAALQNLFL
jgi:hypothetical protein